ncbi:unnamed protein product, partial [Gongylonema pulchrum]|uniref:RING-type domain-containing protein n=1 Tax=Gongylonema pulchrum TaxID=637853 RepID=A0A183DZC5_9BILA
MSVGWVVVLKNCFFQNIHRGMDSENQECKICLQSLAHAEKLLECPSCEDSFHHEGGEQIVSDRHLSLFSKQICFVEKTWDENVGNYKLLQVLMYELQCGVRWLQQNSTCPNCRRLWSNPDEFPTLTST